MKVQRKLLTGEQKKEICKKYRNCEDGCPLYAWVDTDLTCWQHIAAIEQDIEDYWNEEIEVDE